MKKFLGLMLGVVLLSLLAGCGNAGKSAVFNGDDYKNGSYTGSSSADDSGAVGEITIEIREGKIIKADYKTIQKDGKVKDEEYGKTNGKIENESYYNKAQNAVKAMTTYGEKLVEVQNIDQVDAISGATISHNQFVEAVQRALEQAKK